MVSGNNPIGGTTIDVLNQALPNSVRVISILEVGGQGCVYTGSVDGQPSAVKLYSAGQISRRIEREVEALGKFNCPNIVKLLWAGEIVISGQPRQVVATSLVPGKPLSSVIKKRQLTFGEMGILAVDVAEAVENMWSMRVVHRDLKPSNIMLMPNGRACVIDLGVARHLDQATLTALGASWGTFGYLSPEQTRGVRQLTCKSDLFALGIVLLEIALRKHPTNGDQLRLFAENYHLRLPASIESWEHASILRRMLDPQPTKRPLPLEVIKQIGNLK